MRYWTIATDDNNDIRLDGLNNIAMSEDAPAVANIVKNRQRTVIGEIQYNIDEGIPYFTTVFCHPTNVPMFEKFINDNALQTPGVTDVLNLTVNVREDTVNFNMNLQTEFGKVSVNG